MTWYISDLARFRSERERLDVLVLGADWFIPVGWRIDDSVRLVLDAEIVAGGRVYPVLLQYPDLFPHTPPSVFPRGENTRWSHHQFGPGGELCLEYGPDTWTPDLTGVHLIESAHRLLEGENPTAGQQGPVPSRHLVSLGQRIRSQFSRLLLTRESERILSAVPPSTPLAATIVSAHHKESVVQVVSKVTLPDGTTWIDKGVPTHLAEEYFERSATILRLDSGASLPPTTSLHEFRDACAAFGLNAEHRHAIILRGTKVHPYFIWEQDDSVMEIAVVPAQSEAQRLDASHEVLKSKRVALIGCGSLGSKLGLMLARSGVGKFLLVDDDILFPDNFVRNDLDWRDIGTHKVAAVARRMQLVNPAVETQTWRVLIGGQESSASADSVLSTMGECDLIFDATANPDSLNLASAVASATAKPVIWAEVFGGGIGGLIARCRPGVEPPPQYMRRAIENWFADHGSAPVRSTRSYATGGDGAPLIADDADVSVIAAHAARFGIDLLIGREPSLFPNSVYVIGLGPGSVFTQPFETFPIEVGAPLAAKLKEELSPEANAEEIAKVVELIRARKNEAKAASGDNQTPQA